MTTEIETFVNAYKAGFAATIDAIDPAEVEQATQAIHRAFEEGRQIFIAGNGGSAATASHMACDLAKTTLGKSKSLPAKRMRAIALTDNMPLVTAWGNDVGYDCVFAEQLRNLANAGDLLVVISASGNSPNILEAVNAARELCVRTVALAGFEGGAVAGMVDCAVIVRNTHYGYIEDAHSVISHLITDYLKESVQR
jgi:D-sedoheptulose 7-phosphate isomerase